MNVYEAIEKSPVHKGWHNKCGVASQGDYSTYLAQVHNQYPDGWQPLAVLEQYTLGEPLTESVKGQRYIAVRKHDNHVDQGTFVIDNQVLDASYTYYADPRPLPKLPEKKEEPKEEPELFTSGLNGRYYLTDEGRRRLERLLRKDGE